MAIVPPIFRAAIPSIFHNRPAKTPCANCVNPWTNTVRPY